MCVGPPCWQGDSGEISDLTHMILLNPKPHSFAKSEPWPYLKLSGTEHFPLVLEKKCKVTLYLLNVNVSSFSGAKAEKGDL